MRPMTSTTTLRNSKMDGGASQQRRSGFSITLQDELHQAIEQGHNSTRMLQCTIACLREQLHQQTPVYCNPEEQWKGNCSKMEDEVHRWKGQCRTLEEATQEKSRKLDEMEWDQQNLRDENTDLWRILQQREKELNDWKEDCMFFAVKFMNWGPSLLKWGPALHHEFEQKLLQKRKKKNSNVIIPDRKLKSNVAVGSLRSTFMEKSGAVGVGHRHRDLAKDCNHDDHAGNQSSTNKRANKWWTSEKRKCLSCSSAVGAPGSPSSREFHR